ncbi:MAG TPA: hypothetical protein VE973_03445 [Candidatus Limnocylindria bacterium]|nr:hypothetical protein [Candidatus Limnocylindria bacterium]
MKALFTFRSAKEQSSTLGIIALISLLPVLVPHIALGAGLQTSGNQSQIFEIKVADSSLLDSTTKTNDNQNSLSIETVTNNDPLVINLKAFLDSNDSPLGEYASEIVKQPQWQRALAISYVESHMGRDCFNNNCSGMGGAPGTPTWRKYSTKLDWFKDLSNLLEKPVYKEKYTTFQKMKGVYVQPGSAAWVNGAQSKYDKLMAITEQSESQRRDLAQQHNLDLAALSTFTDNQVN